MEFAVPIIIVGVVAVLAILRGMGKLPLVRGEAARRLIAAATILGRAYAAEVQDVLGEGGTPLQQSLQADCLTGSWAASMFLQDRPDSSLKMSPGDLDKAVMALLVSSDRGADLRSGNATVGTAFQRIAGL